jgi:orotate phosphoribosyltransferase
MKEDKMSNYELYWIERFKEIGAFWFHDGNMDRPHALLTSGKHSSGFFNCSKIIEDPRIVYQVCFDLLSLTNPEVDYVCGPAVGGIPFAYELAKILKIKSIFTEKDGDDLRLKRFSIPNPSRVLMIEDVITTSGSIKKTIEDLMGNGAQIYDELLCVLNRSEDIKEVNGFKVVSLISCPMPMWKPIDCPLCMEGSEALRPKFNWDKLTGE